jgi:hypothetical protein
MVVYDCNLSIGGWILIQGWPQAKICKVLYEKYIKHKKSADVA